MDDQNEISAVLYATPPVTTANRAVDYCSVIITEEGNELAVLTKRTAYSIDVEWNENFLREALTRDVSDQLGFEYGCVSPLLSTLEVKDGEGIDDIAGWADLLATIVYKPKPTKREPKPKRVTRISKVVSLRDDVANLRAELVSAQTRRRVLENTSPAPHGESGELTLGSTREMAEVDANIAALKLKLEAKYDAIHSQLAAINAVIKPDDSGWVLVLPEPYDAIVALNKAQAAVAPATEEAED